jgi:hypothetical protein
LPLFVTNFEFFNFDRFLKFDRLTKKGKEVSEKKIRLKAKKCKNAKTG